MEQALIGAGLSPPQAQAYIYIIDNFPVPPAALATHLKLSRTNAYKLADKLVGLGLVIKAEGKKITYTPADPIALSGLLAEARTKMVALEKATKEAMKLVKNRIVADESTAAKVYKGKAAVVELFAEQARKDLPVYFVSSAADLPVMGFATMHRVRNITGPSRAARYGITPDVPGAVKNPNIDTQSRLVRTWIPREDYQSPVEWSVCGDALDIFVYADTPYAIQLKDKHVAEAFRLLWQSLDTNLRGSKRYTSLPEHANRTFWQA